MIRKQKKLIFIFVCLFILAFSFASFSYVNESNQLKKVISIVYDDSGSMSNNGQDFAYASYGLQNIIGLMNPCDKLSIVKMSDKDRNISFHIDNYETRKAELEEVKSYRATGEDTDFKTIETALEYLYDMKSMHGDDSSYEYYLVVLTDGQFDNYPKNLTEYLAQIPQKFGSSKYRGIFIGIGENIPAKFESDILAAPNNYYVESDNNDEIVNALYVAHDIIYDRTVLREDEYKYDETNSSITFNPKDKINKVIVFEQNQQVAVTDVFTYDVKANEKLIFTGTKSVSPKLDSYIVHARNEVAQLPKEKVTIYFLDKVDTSKKNLRIMVEYAGVDTKEYLKNSTKSTEPTNIINQTIESQTYDIVEPETSETDDKLDDSGGGGLGDSSKTKKSIEFHLPEPIIPTTEIETGTIETIKPIPLPDPIPPEPFPGCTRCTRYTIGLRSCGCSSCGPFPLYPEPYPWPSPGPNPITNPWVYSIYSLILSILPVLILLALLYGYLKKPKFDRKEHAFEKYEGKTQLDTGSMIKVNTFSKLVPYMAENGFGNDLAIKAAKKKDRIIIPKKYLTPDMKIENQEIDLTRDLQLFEDTAFTKVVDGKVYKYIYRYHPILDKNN